MIGNSADEVEEGKKENEKEEEEEEEIEEEIENEIEGEAQNEETKIRLQLKSLPSYSYSSAVSRLIKSLKQSAENEDEMLFIFRINSLVDENGFALSTGRSVLSLEGLSSAAIPSK